MFDLKAKKLSKAINFVLYAGIPKSFPIGSLVVSNDRICIEENSKMGIDGVRKSVKFVRKTWQET